MAKLARNYIPALKQGYKIANEDLESGGIETFGNVYWVDATNGKSGNDGLSRDSAWDSIATANDNVTTNSGDVIMLSANATHTLTEMLTVSKNRIHFHGTDLRGGFGIGARTKVSLGVTTATTDIATMKNTGVGNTFSNIKFMNSNTVDEGIYGVAEGGEYTVYNQCEFYKETDLDVTGAAEVLNNGDSVQWLYCTIGSSANEIVGAILRPCMLVTATLAGKKCRDNIMYGCILLRKCGNTGNRFIYGANATDVERMFYIDDTLFFSNPLGSATPALGVDFGAAQTEGAVVLGTGCSSVDVTALGATGEGVYTLAPSSPTYATSGKAVAS